MKKMITIENLNKTYVTDRGNNVEALQNINLNVQNNDFVCIVGPSGCGKSTLLRITAGLDTATSGFVYYQGQPVNKPNKEIGMVFQEYSLLPWRSVLDNVALGLEFSGKSSQECQHLAKEYLCLVGLDAFANAYPYELSGGMQQRVAIARALANNPQVLLMDEPFGALDAHTRILMQRELLTIWQKNRKTILFVTHSVDEAIYLADYIVVMSAHPGRIKEIINVNMPRPRDRANPYYGQLSAKILDMLEEESQLAKAVACG
jgi:ABC-type nitrate/sulfonate/bicarbonate transport system ATPase subunit